MSIPDVSEITTNPIRLVFDPTDLSLPYPFGGTAIGTTKGHILRYQRSSFSVFAEEFGGEVTAKHDTGFSYLFLCILREWDSDAIDKIYPNTVIGDKTGERVVVHPGTATPAIADRGVKLLGAPLDIKRGIGFIMYNALPELDEAADILLEHINDFELPLVFTGIRDGSSRVIKKGRFPDLISLL